MQCVQCFCIRVAIPVVVDLLLRQIEGLRLEAEEKVAIPVVVDLLLRLRFLFLWPVLNRGRNPCCSGPTASTAASEKGAKLITIGRNPCCSGPTASTCEIIEETIRKV